MNYFEDHRRVDRIFEAARNIVPANILAVEAWLSILEDEARKPVPGWEARLVDFLAGIFAVGQIDKAQMEQFERELLL